MRSDCAGNQGVARRAQLRLANLVAVFGWLEETGRRAHDPLLSALDIEGATVCLANSGSQRENRGLRKVE